MDLNGEGTSTSDIVTIPNLISLARVLLIPVFAVLLRRPGHEVAGLLVLATASASDWIDGYLARRSGRVSELGKVLDPTADRLVVAAGLIVLAVRGALPVWAALLVLGRDTVILLAGLVLLASRRARVEVRWIGKVATFSLMAGVPLIAWGNFGLRLAEAASAVGWTAFVLGIVGSYAAFALYVGDFRRAWNASG